MVKLASSRTSNLGRLVHTAPLVAPTLMSLAALVSIVLVLLGVLYTWLFLLVLLPLSFAASSLIFRSTAKTIPKNEILFDGAAVLFSLLWVFVNAFFAAQHLFVDRDPGFYANGAVWVMDNPDLNFAFEDPFVTGTQLDSPGFNARDDGQFTQGTHTFPTTLGVLGRFVGLESLFRSTVLFGGLALLAVYSFGRQFCAAKWALASTIFLGVLLPFVYFSRDTYTEPMTMMAIFAGLSTLHLAFGRDRPPLLWLLAGTIFATAVVIRIDGLLLLAPLIFAMALLHSHVTKRQVALFVGPLIAGSVIMWVDLTQASPLYYSGHRSDMLSLVALAAGAAVAGVLLILDLRRQGLAWRLYRQLQSRISDYWLLAGIAFIAIVLASRPIWYEHTGDSISLSDDGQQRLFGEQTLNWILIYIGPVAGVLAGIGFCLTALRLHRGRFTGLLPWFLIFGATAALYINLPNITPDHVWASRRFLPVIFPSLAIFAAIGLDFIERRFAIGNSGPKQITSYLLATLALLIFPAVLTRPYAVSANHENLSTVKQVCAELDRHDEPAVIWVGLSSVYLNLSTNAVCQERSTTYNFGEITPGGFATIMEGFDDDSQTPIVGILESHVDGVEAWEHDDFQPVADIKIVDIERTLVKRPTETSLQQDRVLLARIMPDGTIEPLKPNS